MKKLTSGGFRDGGLYSEWENITGLIKIFPREIFSNHKFSA